MAAITQDWQARIVDRDFVIGRGTNYPGIGAIEGIGILPPTSDPSPRWGDGDTFGRDRLGNRVITLPVRTIGDTDAGRWSNYRALAVAWRRAMTELELQLRIPGSAETIVSYFGRPGSLPGAPHGLKLTVDTVAEFHALPYAYGAARTLTAILAASPLTIPTAGDPETNTDRAVITITGNGGTPTITNTTTGGAVAFNRALAGGATYILDLHTQTAVKAGVSSPDHMTPTSDWFTLTGNINNLLAFTGAASISVTWRPAYQVP